ncbi:hypothetical protein MJO29_004684 [Puccinia striiformis f. sp. tritici]|nr:hypothetical protein MJO29_004684 [Puccinia striiformis f. sp. tritici]
MLYSSPGGGGLHPSRNKRHPILHVVLLPWWGGSSSLDKQTISNTSCCTPPLVGGVFIPQETNDIRYFTLYSSPGGGGLHPSNHPRSIIILTQTESFGQVGPELQLELEKLSNQIDQEEDQASTSSAAPFMVCASHKLFGQIGSTLKLDLTHPQHYPLLLSPAMAIPLSTVLLELIYPLPDLLSIESAEFQTELKSQLSLPQRIIRPVLQNLVKYVIEGHPSTDSSESSVVGNTAWREHDEAMLQTLLVIFQNHSEEGELRLSSKSCHVLSRVFKIDELLSSMCGAYEVSAFWKSLIQGLVKSTLKSDVVAEELLVKLAQLFQLPAGLIETLIAELLSTLLPMEIPHRAVLRPLGILFQRHPNLVEQVSQNLISTSDANAEESIPRILNLLSGDFPLTTDQCGASLWRQRAMEKSMAENGITDIVERRLRRVGVRCA